MHNWSRPKFSTNLTLCNLEISTQDALYNLEIVQTSVQSRDCDEWLHGLEMVQSCINVTQVVSKLFSRPPLWWPRWSNLHFLRIMHCSCLWMPLSGHSDTHTWTAAREESSLIPTLSWKNCYRCLSFVHILSMTMAIQCCLCCFEIWRQKAVLISRSEQDHCNVFWTSYTLFLLWFQWQTNSTNCRGNKIWGHSV